jgi:tetratricopeptide (TPR) repeat protein
VDWAQQLKETKVYLDEHKITNCWFAYFADGAIEPEDYGIHCKRLPTTSSLWWLNLPMEVPPVISGTVLISDSDLEGIEFGQGALNPYDSFRGVKPTAVIEHGLDVYDGSFAVPLMSALVQAHEAETLLAAGKIQAALSKAQAAEVLAPRAVSVQSALGDVLAKMGRRPEALRHYRAALQAAKEIEPELQKDSVPGLEAAVKGLE